jgi:AraC-like DNA-binding protein
MADILTMMGGSIDRVFQSADLPIELLHIPDTLVPLREHFRLLNMASRELRDDLFSARVGQQVSIENLGPFGKWVTQASTLHEAILRANASLPSMLQSATNLVLRFEGHRAKWSYELGDPATEGRQQNEVLALSYMIAVVRYFLGPSWAPEYIIVGGKPITSNGRLEHMLHTNVVFRDSAGAIVLDRRRLWAFNPDIRQHRRGLDADELERGFGIPDPSDLARIISTLMELELLGRRPTLDRLCLQMGITRRTLQRRLFAQHGVRFSELLQEVLRQRAFTLLRSTDRTVTEIATALDYNDAAHFARAFERWTGTSPSQWRTKWYEHLSRR